MVGFDFIIGLVFMVLCVQFPAFHIESERIAVDSVEIIFLTGNQSAVFLKNRFPGIFVILEHEIALRFSVIGICTRYMF